MSKNKMDLIDRATLPDIKVEIPKCIDDDTTRILNAVISAILMTIKSAPTVDAEPVRHGHWIPQDSTRTKFMCSDCKSRNHDGSGKYCSLCGCKMDAEVE